MKEIFKKIFVAVFFSIIWLLPSGVEAFRTHLYSEVLFLIISLLPVLIIKKYKISIPISLTLCVASCFIYKEFIFYYAPIICIICMDLSRRNAENKIQPQIQKSNAKKINGKKKGCKKNKSYKKPRQKQKPDLIFALTALLVTALQIFFLVDFINFIIKYSFSFSELCRSIDGNSVVWILLFFIFLSKLIYSFKNQDSNVQPFIYSQKFVNLSAFLFLLKSMQSFLIVINYSIMNERFAFYGWLIYLSLLLKENEFDLNELLSLVKKSFRTKVTE